MGFETVAMTRSLTGFDVSTGRRHGVAYSAVRNEQRAPSSASLSAAASNLFKQEQ